MQTQRNAGGLSVGDDRPGQLLIRALIGALSRGEVLGHRNNEHAVPAAGQEVRRLTQVGSPRLYPVVRPNRDIQHLGRVAVQIPDEKAPGAVGVGEPPFERAGDAGAKLPPRLTGQLLGRQPCAAGDRAGGTQRRESCHGLYSPAVALTVLFLRFSTNALYSSSLR